MNIHFICRGNVLRSLIGETYLKSLQLSGINTSSSGTKVNLDDPQEREYFANTIAVLKRHSIESYAKDTSHQLTQQRASDQDVTVCMNQRVVDEANLIVSLPGGTRNWNIVDIGEGHRTDRNDRLAYEEDIYQEITARVDELVREFSLA